MDTEQPQNTQSPEEESLAGLSTTPDEPVTTSPDVSPETSSAPELLYGVLFHPQKTYRELVREPSPPVGLAVVVFCTVMTLGAWVAMYTSGSLPEGRYIAAFRNVPVILIGLVLLLGLLAWFGWAATLQLTSEFMGGTGRGISLFALTGLSFLPRVFSAPVAVIANIVGPRFGGVLQVALFLWVIALNYTAVRSTHGLSRTRAVLALVLPGVALLGLTLLGALLLLLAVLPFLNDLGDLPL